MHQIHSPIKTGKRAIALKAMHEAKLPVPLGFVVASDAFLVFCEHNSIQDEIDRLLTHTRDLSEKELKEIGKQIKKKIREGEFPEELVMQIIGSYVKLGEPRVMLFPSIHSEPSYHGINTDEHIFGVWGDANLFEAIKELWSMHFDAKALFYRQKQQIPHFSIPFAISVQEQPQGKVSVVLFTDDPTSQTKQTALAKAVHGEGALEEQLDGADYYWIKRGSGERYKEVTDTQRISITFENGSELARKTAPSFQKKRKLTAMQLMMLGKIAKDIQQHFFFPQKVLLTWTGEKFFIVETTPVQHQLQHTGLSVSRPQIPAVQHEDHTEKSMPQLSLGLSHVLTPAGHIPSIHHIDGHLAVNAEHLLEEKNTKVVRHQLQHTLQFTLSHCQPQKGILYLFTGNDSTLEKVTTQIESLRTVRLHFPLLHTALAFAGNDMAEFSLFVKELHRFGLTRDSRVSYLLSITTPASIYDVDQFVQRGIDGIYLDLDAIDTALHGTISNPKHILYDKALVLFLKEAVSSCEKAGIACFLASTRLPDRAILDALQTDIPVEWITTAGLYSQLHSIYKGV